MDDVIKACKQKCAKMEIGNWRMNRVNLQELMFADDMVLIADTERNLQENLNIYQA